MNKTLKFSLMKIGTSTTWEMIELNYSKLKYLEQHHSKDVDIDDFLKEMDDSTNTLFNIIDFEIKDDGYPSECSFVGNNLKQSLIE